MRQNEREIKFIRIGDTEQRASSRENQHWTGILAAAAKSLQSCSTLCGPIDGSPPGSPVPGILQTRTLEWVAISFSNAQRWKVKVKSLSRVRLLTTPWTAAYQAPPSMGFSRQEYWSGLPLPSPNVYKYTHLYLYLSIHVYLCVTICNSVELNLPSYWQLNFFHPLIYIYIFFTFPDFILYLHIISFKLGWLIWVTVSWKPLKICHQHSDNF